MIERAWTTLSRNVAGPKLKWLENRLTDSGIKYKFGGTSPVGPILLVSPEDLVDATEILCEQITESNIGQDGPVLTWADLDNNHPIFSGEFRTEAVRSPADTEKSLPSKLETLPGGHVVQMYDVESSNLSALGFLNNFAMGLNGILYIRFKGGTLYRYHDVPAERWNTLLDQALSRFLGNQEASVGSAFHHLVKVPADEGKLECEKFDNGTWTRVPPKSERVKALKDKVK